MKTAVLAMLALLAVSGADSGKPDAPPPYEMLQPNASWCGPRVLYFFSCYFGQGHSLEEVVSACHADPEGYTTLQNLDSAARSLDMDPLPIQCDVDQLLDLGGPAIICVGRPDSPAASASTPMRIHFIGLFGRKRDRFLVIDPSLRTEPLAVPRERIAQSFTGQAVLLKGCPRPWLRPSWLVEPWWAAAIAVSAAACLAVALMWFLVCRARSRVVLTRA